MTRPYSHIRCSTLRFFRPALACLLTLLLPTLVRAATLNVPSQYPTIQAGVNAAANGDTVLVADGTYSGDGNRDIDFVGKSLTITSQHGAVSTIIDCGGYKTTNGSGNHRGFYIHSGEKIATISGLTIKNGYETYVSGDPSHGSGGGVCIFSNTTNGTTTLTGCTISGNTTTYGDGGGVYNYSGGTTTLTGCTVSGNTGYNGGGVYNNGGTTTLTSCTVSGNTANNGGGVYNYGGHMLLTGCAVSGNIGYDGGGVCNYYSGGTSLTGCTISGNTGYDGGGVYNNASRTTITGCIVYQNISGELVNNPGSTTNAVATYSDIRGGYSGTGNINKDPLFVNAAYGDLHLKPGSPCIGAGTTTGAPITDKDGNLRPSPPSIGAYEGAGRGVVIQRPVGSLTLYDAGYDFAHTDLSDNAVGPVNVAALAGDTQVCTGAVTDGATKVLLRYNASAAGTVTFTETNGVSGDSLRTVSTSTQVVNGQNVAFALYTVPESLDTTAEAKASPNHFTQHTVSFQAAFAPASGAAPAAVSVPLILESPPVILIHGLWSSAGDTWNKTGGVRDALVAAGYVPGGANQSLFLVNYSDTNTAKLDANQAVLLLNRGGIREAYTVYHTRGVAVTRVDVVGHSMGGLVTRKFAAWSAYSTRKNFHKGYVRRMITIGTPHFGSPLGNYLTDLHYFVGTSAIVDSFLHLVGKDYGPAIDDLHPGSSGLAALGATGIPCYAEVGNYDIQHLGDLKNFYNVLLFFGYRLHIGNSPSLQQLDQALFLGQANDGVVPIPSQEGDLSDGYYTVTGLTNHLQECGNGDIGAEVARLVTGPLNAFSTSGFAAPHAVAATPRLQTPHDATVIAPFVTVTAPAAGQVFHVGDTLTVSLRPNAGTTLAQALVQAGSSPRDIGSALLGQSPYTATFTVPINALGIVPVAVTAKDSAGNVCTVTVNIAVQTNAALSSMTAAARATAPSGAALLTSQGSTTPLTVTGTFSDATQADITASALGTTYTSSDPSVATVSAEGILTAQADGNCIITVTNGTVTATESVIVQLGTPTVLSITPASGKAGTSVSLALVGSDLGGASKIQFYLNGAPDPNITATTLQATPQGNGLTATVTLAPGTAAGLRTVVVTTPGGSSDTLAAPDAAGFTVTPASSGRSHILWTNTNGQMAVWTLDKTTGAFTHIEYGPYAGWTARAIAEGMDGIPRVLWTNTNGQAALWTVDTATGAFTHLEYGPYSGWTAKSLAVGPDNTAHLLWNNVSGQLALWTVSSTGGFADSYAGPYSGWSGTAIAFGSDNQERLLWNNTSGQVSLWTMPGASTATFTHLEYGPYSGWSAVGVSASR